MAEPQIPTGPTLKIEKIYIKDLSLEIPNAPQIFLEREQPQVEVQLNTSANKVDEGIYESTLSITVTSKVGDKTAFLVEISEAGIFQLRNIPDADLESVLGIACPNIIFPYAREVISDVLVRAGFPPMLLAPVNFEALFQQQKQAAAQAVQPVTH